MVYSHIGGDPRESFKDQQDTFDLIESFMGYYQTLIYLWLKTQN